MSFIKFCLGLVISGVTVAAQAVEEMPWHNDHLGLQSTGTSHHTGNHIRAFRNDDSGHAHGVVYSKNAHETGSAVTDSDFYPAPSSAEVALGQVLFFDKIISGNRNISCATCHHPLAGTGDGLALPIGEGGKGLGVTRDTGIGGDAVHERVPRNAQPLFNLGAKEFAIMFHDGRVTVDNSQPSGFNTPAGGQLPSGLANPLAVQAMLPVTSSAEMAGQPGENPVADAAAEEFFTGENGVWSLLTQRLRAIPEYVALFRDAYPGQITTADDIQFKDAANAIAAFEATAWRADNSRYDQYLRDNNHALTDGERKGMELFYGIANCSSCHSGKFQTDQSFHAIAMPQIGPGKGHNSEGYSDGREDFGREAVIGDENDRFRFRTPTLRNVALTAPYGHAGAFDTLEAVVRHHLNPVESLLNYDASQVRMPSRADLDEQDFVVMNDYWRVEQIAHRNELASVDINEAQLVNLMSFLHALTDNAFLDDRRNVPRSVPSGMTLAE
jgi:cytochrome c peroxidase